MKKIDDIKTHLKDLLRDYEDCETEPVLEEDISEEEEEEFRGPNEQDAAYLGVEEEEE